jgi:hypothetical protein
MIHRSGVYFKAIPDRKSQWNFVSLRISLYCSDCIHNANPTRSHIIRSMHIVPFLRELPGYDAICAGNFTFVHDI